MKLLNTQPLKTTQLKPKSMASHCCFLNNHLMIEGLKTRISKQTNHKIIISRKGSNNVNRNPRRLITISPGDSKWHNDWDSEYVFSLRDLRLQDLVDDENELNKNARVSVKLAVQKHASFGYSVDGRIITSFPTKCSNCTSPYCRKIDTEFNVWILSSRRENRDNEALPEIGDDPSVIYVKPGSEADLDSLVRDTLRIATSIKDTCSELCEKSSYTMQNENRPRSGSIDRRWARLLELKNSKLS